MRLLLPVGVLVAVAAGAVAVAVWASVADAPWEHDDGQGNASVLCQDALERRKAVEDALQRPVSLSRPIYRLRSTEIQGTSETEGPLSAFRDDPLFSDEVKRLESELVEIKSDIQRFCE
jgi:hypothetical protein